jgi:hypothetical protein
MMPPFLSRRPRARLLRVGGRAVDPLRGGFGATVTEPFEPTSPGPRSVFLSAAAWIGNVYLVAFALDAVLSIPDLVAGDPELHAMASTNPRMYAARVALALAVVMASVLMPFLLLFVPQLPKPPFVAPVAFVLAGFGRFLTTVPVEVFSVVQPVVAALSFVLVRRATGAWLLSPTRLPRRRHLLARAAFATVVTVVALPLTVAAVLLLIVLNGLERQTADYLDVTLAGIDLRETVMTKDGHTVVLKGMLHFGEEDFYRTLFDGLPPGSVVLAEGVTDREKRLTAFPSLSNLAKALGLARQPSPKAMLPPSAAVPDRAPEVGGPAGGSDGAPEIVNADVDATAFSEPTLALLRDIASLYDSQSMMDILRRLLAHGRPTADVVVAKHELVDMRNAKLLATFDEREASRGTIVIPWGAMHMAGIETGLEARGYHVATQRKRPVVRFGKLLSWLIAPWSAAQNR